MTNIVAIDRDKERVFFFQGLPIQEYKDSALVQALRQYLDVDAIRYFKWLDSPAHEQLDLAPPLEAAVAEVMSRQPTGRVNLLGYSNGGYAAMYVASQLVLKGRELGFVALLDSSSYFPFKQEPLLRQRLAKHRGASVFRRVSLFSEHVLISLLHGRRFEMARRLTLLAVFVRGREAAGNMIALTLALYWKEAVLRFPPRIYTGKVDLFVAEFGRPRITDPFLGWVPYAANIDKVVLKGDHWTLTQEPHAFGNAVAIAQALRLRLA